jgi:hypothetical protein
MMAITNKDLMIYLVLKKLDIHGQEFRSKRVLQLRKVHLPAAVQLAGILHIKGWYWPQVVLSTPVDGIHKSWETTV